MLLEKLTGNYRLIEGNGLLGQKLLEKGYKIYNPSTYKDENNQSITSLTIDRESK